MQSEPSLRYHSPQLAYVIYGVKRILIHPRPQPISGGP